MKAKIKKLLFEHSVNSRDTSKRLGKKTRTSQQSAHYLLNSLKKKKQIEGTVTIVDAIKLGFIQVIVGVNFLNPALKKEIIDELKEIPSITSIEECKEGIDLLVGYTTQNLSAFNKLHSEMTYKFYKKLKTDFVFPIIVSHEYNRNYLSRKFKDTDMILFGDRDLEKLSENEMSVLEELVENPDNRIIDISNSLNISVKSVVRIKKTLEKKSIIRGYTSILNYSKLDINRQIIFLKFSSEGIKQIEKFHTFTKYDKNIVNFMKIIGEFQLAVFVEDLKDIEIIKEIRANFPIESYRVIKCEKIHKKGYLPLLS